MRQLVETALMIGRFDSGCIRVTPSLKFAQVHVAKGLTRPKAIRHKELVERFSRLKGRSCHVGLLLRFPLSPRTNALILELAAGVVTRGLHLGFAEALWFFIHGGCADQPCCHAPSALLEGHGPSLYRC